MCFPAPDLEVSTGFMVGFIMILGHSIHMISEYKRSAAMIANRENFPICITLRYEFGF